MGVREVLIDALQSLSELPLSASRDLPGIALVFSIWLGIDRPQIEVTGGRFTIRCAAPRGAKLISEHWGGTADGAVVTGYVVDLTS